MGILNLQIALLTKINHKIKGPWVKMISRHVLKEHILFVSCRPSYVCPSVSCTQSMDLHIRRFVHGQGAISLTLKRGTKEKPLSFGNHIRMWSWCPKCKKVKGTEIVKQPISQESFNINIFLK